MAAVASTLGLHQRLIAIFPKLAETAYQLTSQRTDKYNCIAWAAGEDGYWWWPGRFWPQGVPRAVTKLAFKKAFADRGYVECGGPELEEGFEKVCLYTKLNRPTHAARQLADGRWTSKLGKSVDIAHELEGLRGVKYGQPTLYMKRPREAEIDPNQSEIKEAETAGADNSDFDADAPANSNQSKLTEGK